MATSNTLGDRRSKLEDVKDVLDTLDIHVERNHLQRIVTSYVPATDTKPAKIKAINTMGEKGEEVLVEVGGDMDLQDYHDLAAMRMAVKLNWLPKYYLLRAITNWGDPEKDELLLSGFIYLLRERKTN